MQNINIEYLSKAILRYTKKMDDLGTPILLSGIKETLERFISKHDFTVNYHRPVCPKCHIEFHPEKNGVGVLDMADFGPCDLYDADLWKCPSCESEVVVGFGRGPISSHYKVNEFASHIKFYEANSILINNKG